MCRLDANVVLPPPSMGDGPFWRQLSACTVCAPLKTGNDTFAQEYAKAGYAVLSHTARGFYNSRQRGLARRRPGGLRARVEPPRRRALRGTRQPAPPGPPGGRRPRAARRTTRGESYGGGRRARRPCRATGGASDGRYAPFRSPKGVPMEIAAAAPDSPSPTSALLAPNGRGLDYLADGLARRRAGRRSQAGLRAAAVRAAGRQLLRATRRRPRGRRRGVAGRLRAGRARRGRPVHALPLSRLPCRRAATGAAAPHSAVSDGSRRRRWRAFAWPTACSTYSAPRSASSSPPRPPAGQPRGTHAEPGAAHACSSSTDLKRDRQGR